MSIELFEHNKAAYDAAFSILTGTGKAAVFTPPVSASLLSASSCVKTILINGTAGCPPQEYIFKTQLENLEKSGAEAWGGGVQRLIVLYPEAKLLGLSATNIRYLDNQRDMADELFDGNVASEMTLGTEQLCRKCCYGTDDMRTMPVGE